jgi:hypothetical protein
MEAMNRRSALILGAAALAGVVAFPMTGGTASAEEHRYKRIHDAYVALESAKEEIEGAGHDFGGHKREAIEAIDHALHHLDILRDWHR